MTLRCLIVDDEAVARDLLRSFIQGVPWLVCAGVATDGRAAAETIDAVQPDIVFLNVRLPGLSGVEVLESITFHPAVVFTTAYDEYAIRAFELGALDYLLKPFGPARFLETAQRIRQRLQRPDQQAQGQLARAREVLAEARPLRRMFVRRQDEVIPVDLARVERIESEHDYVVLYQGGTRHLAHIPLAELETMLDPERFVRVHRSHIVNLDYVAAFREHDPRRFVVLMRDGSTVMASRARTSTLRRRIT